MVLKTALMIGKMMNRTKKIIGFLIVFMTIVYSCNAQGKKEIISDVTVAMIFEYVTPEYIFRVERQTTDFNFKTDSTLSMNRLCDMINDKYNRSYCIDTNLVYFNKARLHFIIPMKSK